MAWWQRVIDTPDDSAALVARLGLGLVMFPHGAQKMLGWWGGHGFSATLAGMSSGMHLPAPLVVLVILTEFVGALMLVFGLLGRLAALAVGIEMLVAVLMVHVPNGFFMNWTGTQKGEGFEYHVLAIALAIAIGIRGSGRASLDRWLAGRGGRARLTASPFGADADSRSTAANRR